MATPTTITTLAPSQSSFRIPPKISLNNNNFYTGPPRKSTTSSQHHAITTPKKSASSKPERRSRGVPLFPPKSQEALEAWAINDSTYDYQKACKKYYEDNEDDEDDEEDFYGDGNDSQATGGGSQVNPIVIEDDTADLDSEAEGDEASNANDETDGAGEADNRPIPRGLDDGNNGSKDDEDNKELPSLEALEEEVCAPAHNRTIPSTPDGNQTDNSAEGHHIKTVSQFRQELRTSVAAGQGSSGAQKSKKRRFNHIKQPDDIDYISDTSISESSESLRPRKQRSSPASRKTLPSGPPTLGLNNGDERIEERAAFAAQSANPSLQQSSSSRDVRLPQDKVNDNRNQILDDLVNGSAEECDYSDDTEDGEVVDEGNAENCNYGNDDSGDTDDDDAGDGDSSDSDESNEAHGCAGQRGSLAPVSGESKPKRAAKHRLQRPHLSPSIPSMHTSDRNTALSSDYRKRARSPIHNRLRAQKPLSNSASNSNSSKAMLGAVSNTNSEEWLIRAALRRQENGSYVLDILPQRFPLPSNLVEQPQEPKPQEPKARVKFTKVEDALLIKLKEKDNLLWEQIKVHFPTRTLGSLQAHYCSKLKARPAVQKRRGRPAGRKRRQ